MQQTLDIAGQTNDPFTELTKHRRFLPFRLCLGHLQEQRDELLHCGLVIQLSYLVSEEKKQTAKRLGIVFLPTLKFHQQVSTEHHSGMANEHVERATLKLGAQLEIALGKFKKSLDAPPHAVNPNDFRCIDRLVRAEDREPFPSLVAVLHEHELDWQAQVVSTITEPRMSDALFFGSVLNSSFKLSNLPFSR